MEAILSTAQIAELSGDTREWIWELARRGEIPAERANPGGKQYRYFDSQQLRNWCASRKRKRRPWAWTSEHEAVLERKRPRLDSVGKNLWRKLGKTHHLEVSELREFIRKGRVTKIKRERPVKLPGLTGVSTWQGLSFQFRLLMRQIGDSYLGWTPDQKAHVRRLIRPIVEFDRELAGDERKNLA
jgi:predicted DNA-binding transcriptional regulator AlpA